MIKWWRERRLRREFERYWALEGSSIAGMTKQEGFAFFCHLEGLGERQVRRRLAQGVW